MSILSAPRLADRRRATRWQPPIFAALLILALLASPAAAAGPGRPPTYDLMFSGSTTIVEGGLLNVSVTLVGASCSPFSGVNWSTSAVGTGATPAEGGDFMNPSPPFVGFSDGAGSTISVQVQTLADADADDEILTLTLTAVNPTIACSGQSPTSSTYSVDLLIVDSAPQPTVYFTSTAPLSKVEGAASTSGVVVVEAALANPPPVPYSYTVQVATLNGTAAVTDGDFVALGPTTLTFTDSSPGPFNVPVQVNGDNKPEPDETFQIKLVNPGVGVEIDPVHVIDVTIVNDDPTPHLSILDLNWPEGTGGGSPNANITIQVNNAPIGVPLAIDWHTEAGGVIPATPGVDYQTSGGTVILTSPTASGTIDVLVPVVQDSLSEGPETFLVKLDSAAFGSIIDDPAALVTIVDDDFAAVPLVSIIDLGPVTEGDSGTVLQSFEVSVSAAPAPGSSIQFQTQEDSSAIGNEDFTITTGTLNFGPTLPLTQTINVPVRGDTTLEAQEHYFVVLSNPVGLAINTGKAKGVINDDDSGAPIPHLSIAGVSLDEGDAGQVTANFTVTLDVASGSPVTFSWNTADETATAASGDYVAKVSGNGFIPAGTTSIVLPVQVNGDNLVETDETFAVVLSEIAGGVFTTDRASTTIRNDDTEGEFSFSIGDVTVQEGNAGTTTATFTVSLSAARGVVPTIDYSTDSGTATINTDFQPSAGQLVFSDGATSKTVTVNVIGDTLVEGDETFTVKLENATGGASIADGSGLGTIVDDDAVTPPPQPTLTIDDIETNEGNQGATEVIFRLRLDSASTATVTVNFATADLTATVADNDYQAKSGQVSFPPGATEAGITVLVFGDTVVEADERFAVNLSGATQAILGRAQARCLVRNDDVAVPPQNRSSIRLARVDAASEGAGFAVVVVERSGEAVGSASAVVSAVAGTATAGEDFTALRENLSWGDGELGGREVRVPILNDNQVEADETVRISVGEVRGALEGQPLDGELRILDDDAPMRLEIVGAAERDSRAGEELDLQVRALRSDGVPVAGALIQFEAQAGPVRVLGEGVVRSNADGLATQRVALGPAPGLARLRAFLRGSQAEASFVVRVAGNLGQIGGGNNGGDRTVGGALDESCAEASGELAEACAFLYGLGDPNQQRQALAELTPQGVVAQVRAALQAPKNQNRNVSSRLDALRGGGPLQTLDQLSLSIQGQTIGGVGALQQALLRGSVAAPAAPATAPGRRSEEDKVELALRRAAPQAGGAPLLAKQDAQNPEPFADTESPWGMFVNGRMSFGKAPQRGEDPSYDFDSEGITAGVDYRVSSQLVVGAALGFVSTSSKLDADGGAIDTSGWSLNLYGTWYRERWYVESVIGYGRNDYDFKRVIVLPRAFQGRDTLVAKGSPNSRQLSADLGAGYDFRLGEALSLNGFGRFSYVDTQIDEYAEQGGGPFSLGFAGQSLSSLLAEAGVEVTYPWSVSWGVLQPMLRVSYLHEFESDPQVIRARFVGDGGRRFFVVRSERPDRNYLNLAAGISATLPRGWATFLQYDTDLERDELDIYTLSGGLRFQF